MGGYDTTSSPSAYISKSCYQSHHSQADILSTAITANATVIGSSPSKAEHPALSCYVVITSALNANVQEKASPSILITLRQMPALKSDKRKD